MEISPLAGLTKGDVYRCLQSYTKNNTSLFHWKSHWIAYDLAQTLLYHFSEENDSSVSSSASSIESPFPFQVIYLNSAVFASFSNSCSFSFVSSVYMNASQLSCNVRAKLKILFFLRCVANISFPNDFILSQNLIRSGRSVYFYRQCRIDVVAGDRSILT